MSSKKVVLNLKDKIKRGSVWRKVFLSPWHLYQKQGKKWPRPLVVKNIVLQQHQKLFSTSLCGSKSHILRVNLTQHDIAQHNLELIVKKYSFFWCWRVSKFCTRYNHNAQGLLSWITFLLHLICMLALTHNVPCTYADSSVLRGKADLSHSRQQGMRDKDEYYLHIV